MTDADENNEEDFSEGEDGVENNIRNQAIQGADNFDGELNEDELAERDELKKRLVQKSWQS